jgi:menaquinone-dependent protoporphyrinogen oxidase
MKENVMAHNVLVAYATKYGSTAGIAEKIGTVLTTAGVRVDVQSVDSVSDPSSYDAFVIGGAVYIGRMRKEARRFLKRHTGLLSSKPVWLFASGPTDDSEVDPRMSGFTTPQSMLETIDSIKPLDQHVFKGAIDPAKLGGIDKWVIQKVGANAADVRDWDDVGTWAEGIARELA